MSSTTKAVTRGQRSTGAILLEFLGSMSLAITLLVALAIASVIGTVLQQNQPYQDYLLKFGPFWHEIFAGMALYDVYSAGWFLVILTFLVVSTSVCIYRHAPTMVRDMRHFRMSVKEKSLRSFQHHVADELDMAPAAAIDRTSRALSSRGYRVRVKDHGDHQVLSAMKGASNRLGYLFTHVAIVIICVGAVMDGRMPMKLAELTGRLVVETRDIPASQVPPESRLGAANRSFRGTVEIPEGRRANVVFINIRDGFVVQELPFTVEVRQFRVEHHSTGAPRSFESDLVIFDNDLPEPLEQTISVNHPLIYKGHAIYQASFGDGGSRLNINIWPLNERGLEPVPFEGNVFQNYPMEVVDRGEWTLELHDFALHNINPFLDEQGQRFNRNFGPSFTFRLRDRTGVAMEYQNYMAPVEQEGRLFYLSGVRESVADEFQYLHIPADPSGSLQRFMTFHAMLQNPAVIAEVARSTTTAAVAEVRGDDEVQEQVRRTMERLMLLFAQGGYDAIAQEIESRTPPEQVSQVTEVFIRVLHAGLQALYLEVLAEEGVDEITEADQVFLEDAVVAANAIHFYGSPVFLHLTGFDHIEASGLMITKSPGQGVVYFGSIMLTIGIFLMFYVAHRRCWLWVTPAGEGRSRVVFAGTSNRNMVEFDKEFGVLTAAALGKEPASDRDGATQQQGAS
ncbi:cytochrome c biogenesis protein ResB [Thioalkalivibrio sulfidiphilus]|uniref:ResB family protein n=1 Tax=Thioalkalivibrio sulfidiphilus (strain HL-EbGR7) TaxID=396588 RepID=B8GTD4_THISH|nr:cytochrome c biogenesis protein ResB [Thioalkalivibrio sulfidiphilus]ACL71194.1 ResB family protein [Thioalkalivibrio sulfidiphilus HL-EbGr7]